MPAPIATAFSRIRFSVNECFYYGIVAKSDGLERPGARIHKIGLRGLRFLIQDPRQETFDQAGSLLADGCTVFVDQTAFAERHARQRDHSRIRKGGMTIKDIVRRTGYSRGLVRRVLRGQRSDVFHTRESSLELFLRARRGGHRRAVPARRGSPNAKESNARPSEMTLAASTTGRLTSNPNEPKPPFLRPANSLKSSDDRHPSAPGIPVSTTI